MKRILTPHASLVIALLTISALTVSVMARGPVRAPRGPGDCDDPIGDQLGVPRAGQMAADRGARRADVERPEAPGLQRPEGIEDIRALRRSLGVNGNFIALFVPTADGGFAALATPAPVRLHIEELTALYDLDGDGLLSREELAAARADQLAARVERLQAVQALADEMLAEFDADADGILSEEEALAVLLFQLETNVDFSVWATEAWDQDEDGLLGDEEILDAFELLIADGILTPQVRQGLRPVDAGRGKAGRIPAGDCPYLEDTDSAEEV